MSSTYPLAVGRPRLRIRPNASSSLRDWEKIELNRSTPGAISDPHNLISLFGISQERTMQPAIR